MQLTGSTTKPLHARQLPIDVSSVQEYAPHSSCLAVYAQECCQPVMLTHTAAQPAWLVMRQYSMQGAP